VQDDWLFHTSRARELRERERVEFERAVESSVTYVTGFARPDANAERRELVEQVRNAIKQKLAGLRAATWAATGVMAATVTADTTAASRVKLSAPEQVAGALREVFPPHGLPEGIGWKQADRALKAHGGVRSKSTFYRALSLNRARLTHAGQFQG
jgi:hypothetical protein